MRFDDDDAERQEYTLHVSWGLFATRDDAFLLPEDTRHRLADRWHALAQDEDEQFEYELAFFQAALQGAFANRLLQVSADVIEDEAALVSSSIGLSLNDETQLLSGMLAPHQLQPLIEVGQVVLRAWLGRDLCLLVHDDLADVHVWLTDAERDAVLAAAREFARC